MAQATGGHAWEGSGLLPALPAALAPSSPAARRLRGTGEEDGENICAAEPHHPSPRLLLETAAGPISERLVWAAAAPWLPSLPDAPRFLSGLLQIPPKGLSYLPGGVCPTRFKLLQEMSRFPHLSCVLAATPKPRPNLQLPFGKNLTTIN